MFDKGMGRDFRKAFVVCFRDKRFSSKYLCYSLEPNTSIFNFFLVADSWLCNAYIGILSKISL